MVNTERNDKYDYYNPDYNILNIVVNTELVNITIACSIYYNILNIVVNTERLVILLLLSLYYNILNIVVNTEPKYE